MNDEPRRLLPFYCTFASTSPMKPKERVCVLHFTLLQTFCYSSGALVLRSRGLIEFRKTGKLIRGSYMWIHCRVYMYTSGKTKNRVLLEKRLLTCKWLIYMLHAAAATVLHNTVCEQSRRECNALFYINAPISIWWYGVLHLRVEMLLNEFWPVLKWDS